MVVCAVMWFPKMITQQGNLAPYSSATIDMVLQFESREMVYESFLKVMCLRHRGVGHLNLLINGRDTFEQNDLQYSRHRLLQPHNVRGDCDVRVLTCVSQLLWFGCY